jgi:hypothetical protein
MKQPIAAKQKQIKIDRYLESPEYVKKPPFSGKSLKFKFCIHKSAFNMQ